MELRGLIGRYIDLDREDGTERPHRQIDLDREDGTERPHRQIYQQQTIMRLFGK